MASQQAHEKVLGGSSIPFCLQEYINHLTILVYGSPQIMLLAIDLHEDFTDIEGIAIALMASP
jgi:hypothetical protein